MRYDDSTEIRRTHVKIHIIRSQCFESLLQPSRHIRLIRVPHFGSDEDILPFHTAVFDPLPDLILVLVDEGAVEVPVAYLEGVGDGGADFSGLSLPGACVLVEFQCEVGSCCLKMVWVDQPRSG